MTNLQINLLKIWAACIFFGWAWQLCFWEVPLSVILWDETLMKGLINKLGYTWKDFTTNLEISIFQEQLASVWGILFFICGCLSLLLPLLKRWLKVPLYLGGGLLLLLALLHWKDHFYQVGQLLEFSIQGSTIFFLLWAVQPPKNLTKYHTCLRLAVALTFIGHGLYAIGFYPTPGHFTEMFIEVGGLSESSALQILKLFGILDFAAAILIFIPKTQRYALVYCILWGFITAFARIVSNFDEMLPVESLHQWLHATIYRLPHGGIPLVLYFSLKHPIRFFHEPFGFKGK